MDLLRLLKDHQKGEVRWSELPGIIGFHAPKGAGAQSEKAYPALFFSEVLPRLYPQPFQRLDLEGELSENFRQLSFSFLGQSLVYYLGNIETLEKGRKGEVVAFLQKYKGPHRL